MCGWHLLVFCLLAWVAHATSNRAAFFWHCFFKKKVNFWASRFISPFQRTNNAYSVDCIYTTAVNVLMKTLYTCGIRTRVVCSRGRCNVDCYATRDIATFLVAYLCSGGSGMISRARVELFWVFKNCNSLSAPVCNGLSALNPSLSHP
jgi:hypothetical protein